jgi:multiple sugar transport system ATP-binding protein
MAEVTLNAVHKTYPDGFHAVRGVSLTIADGEFVVLVGPSGCGKSTTLRMVAGLEDITGGTISIGGRVVNDVAPKDRDIAMVFQNYALYPHMSVRKNMAFALELRGMPRDKIDARVRDAAHILEIEHLLDRKPKALSGGQKQRVAVGRAIVREPKAFLFDEPLSNLDARLRVTTRAELKALHQRLKTTTIYVTHDQEEAMTLGDRIVVMSKGLVQQADAPLTVYRAPANRFVAGFIGTPPMNFLDGRLVRDAQSPAAIAFALDGQSPAAASATRLPLMPHADDAPTSVGARLGGHVDSAVVLGLRPQTLHLDAAPGLSPLAATIRTIEPLGESMDISATLESGARVVARVPSRDGLRAGERLLLHVDMRLAHVFEPGEFGARL